MIAKLIYEGKTAEEIGLTETEYSSRKEMVDEFLTAWDGTEFESKYRLWLYNKNKATIPSKETTIGEKVKDFSDTAKKVIRSGFQLADDEEQSRRFSICKKCEYYTGTFCRICGCYMRLKTRLEAVKCPRNLWE